MQTLNTKEANLSGRPRTQPALRLKLAIGEEAGHVAQVLPPGGLLVKPLKVSHCRLSSSPCRPIYPHIAICTALDITPAVAPPFLGFLALMGNKIISDLNSFNLYVFSCRDSQSCS